jgi:cation diffusion facilitator CzcD-associated flavoprotein CzcO
MPDYEVAIIGAGLSGLGMGTALKRAGIEDFVIYERAEDIGGTWRDNTYPGVGVDIPTFAYQFSYELKPDWSRVFARGAEVKQYVDDYADKYDLRAHLQLGCDVTERVWMQDEQCWRLTLNGAEEVTARFVISAIGAFVDPKPIAIEGLDDFTGKVIHSARWDHSYSLEGKRVALIGTGASAVQIVPTIAREVAQLDVYQRTPIWISPKFDPPIPGVVKSLFERVPLAQRIAFDAASAITEFILISMVVNYERLPFVVRAVERSNRRFVAASVKDPGLREKLTPDYDFGCKRPSVSNRYLSTFNRSNVSLVTDRIERITPTGVLASDGSERPVDVLVLATGFYLASAPENYRTRPVQGRDGFDLADHYEHERLKAYESISMPGLPNHFMIFGPYGWTGASWHVLVESASRHIVRVIEECRRRGATEVEVTEEATDRYHEFVLQRMSKALWYGSNCATANSYYYDHHGDTPYLRPTSGRAAFKAAKSFPLSDYRFTEARTRPREPVPSALP